MKARFRHSMPYGAEVLDAGGVRFRLWAPAANRVAVTVESETGERTYPMHALDDGWFECVAEAAGAGSRYRYQLEDGSLMPDPASRFQPDDVHAASLVVDPRDYHWRCPDWRGRPWPETVLYETHVGAFTPSGNYLGVADKLDHLAAIGVTALELMPLADFDGSRNWGYDGVLPFAPDAVYGTPAQLKQLVDAAHERGLMIFLDVVYNHFGPSGNYLARYAPQFFTDRIHTPWGAAIDFSQPPVRRFFIHNALYWLQEYRFDGLRLDAVDQIHDPGPEHFLVELAAAVRTAIGDQRHVHLVLENDDNAAHYLERAPGATPRHYTAQWNDDFHHAAHVLITGENNGYYADYATAPAADFGRALAQGFVYQGEPSAYRGGHRRGEPSAHLPSTAFVSFLQNHDQIGNRAFGERLDALADAEAMAALTAVWLLAPQIPLLFMGQEWGEKRPFRFFCDYHDKLADAVREGRRREFAGFAEFADPGSRERIPDPNAMETFTASALDWAARDDRHARERLALIRELLALRRRAIVPRLPAADGCCHAGKGEALRVGWSLSDGTRLTLIANLSSRAVERPDAPVGEVLYVRPADLVPAPGARQLPPWSVQWTLTPGHAA